MGVSGLRPNQLASWTTGHSIRASIRHRHELRRVRQPLGQVKPAGRPVEGEKFETISQPALLISPGQSNLRTRKSSGAPPPPPLCVSSWLDLGQTEELVSLPLGCVNFSSGRARASSRAREQKLPTGELIQQAEARTRTDKVSAGWFRLLLLLLPFLPLLQLLLFHRTGFWLV